MERSFSQGSRFSSLAKVRVGLLGLGTVGSGVVEILSGPLHDRFEVVRALVRNPDAARRGFTPVTTDPLEILGDPSIDVIVEVMGGVEPTFGYLESAFDAGKAIVTANKELVAKKWDWVAVRRSRVRFEAAVAAGIPVIAVLEKLVQMGEVTKISGILNGTTNFILTGIETEGVSFEEMLKRSQYLGYAEAEPSSDIDGWDALYKISILGAMCSGNSPDLDSPRLGIRDVTLDHVQARAKDGKRIKLIASWTPEAGCRVEPQEVSQTSALGMVMGTLNAVSIEGGVNGPLTLVGVGAGGLQTASAVVSDLLTLFPPA